MTQSHGAMRHGAGSSAPETKGRLISWARHYDLFVKVFSLGQMGTVRRRTVELAGVRSGDRVLDVGCGTGDLTLVAAGRAGDRGEVVGIDASPEMIEVARQKASHQGASARFEIGLIERIAFADGYFDVVLSSLMLHHLPGDLKQRGLAEVYRALRPGGRVLVVDMSSRPTRLARAALAMSGHGYGQRQTEDLGPLLAGAGFADVRVASFALGLLDYATGVKTARDEPR